MIHKLLETNSGSLSVSLELQNNPAPFFFIYSGKVIILQFFWICWNCLLKSKVVVAL